MRYLKRVNEFFDSEEVKSELEIDILQGKLIFKDLVRDKNFFKQKDLLLSKVLMNCPFISKLKYNRINKNLLNIGIDITKGKMFSYFIIEIMENGNSYICNIYAKSISNNEYIFNKKLDGYIIDYNELITLINGKGLDLLIEFSNFLKNEFDEDIFPFHNRTDVSKIQGTTFRN